MYYVDQTLSYFNSYEEFLKNGSGNFVFNPFIQKIKVDEIYKIKNAFLLGEPGYGKSFLMKQLFIQNDSNSIALAYIDLKDINENNGLKLKLSNISNIFDTSSSFKKIFPHKSMRTQSFDLNKGIGFVLLDGLDEVKGKNLHNVIKQIMDFLSDYPKVSVIISSRIHFYKRYKNELNALGDFSVLNVNGFTVEEVKEYLIKVNDLDNDKLEKLVKHFNTLSEKSIIQTPRYLFVLSKLLKTHDYNDLLGLNRSALFDKFIYEELIYSAENIEIEVNIDVIKRVLEKVALIMQIHQSTVISKDEFLTILDEVDSNFAGGFVRGFRDFNFFYESGLLKDSGEDIEFLNAEFKEYLASKELVRIGKIEQVLYELAFDENVNSIYPHWHNTLSFIIDTRPDVVEFLMNFISSEVFEFQSQDFHSLLAHSDVKTLSSSMRDQLFKGIFNYYQENRQWIPLDLCEKICNFFSVHHMEFLEGTIDEIKCNNVEELEVRRVNFVHVLVCLIKVGIIEKDLPTGYMEKINEVFNRFVDEPVVNGVLQSRSIWALGHSNDYQGLKKVKQKNIHLKDESIYEALVVAFLMIEPINTFTIDVVSDAVTSDLGFPVIRCKNWLKRIIQKGEMLKELLKHPPLLLKIVEEEKYTFEILDGLLEFIANNLNDDIKMKIEELIVFLDVPIIYRVENLLLSEFFISIFKLMLKEDSEWIERICGKLDEKKLFYFIPLIAKFHKQIDVKSLLTKLKEVDSSDRLAIYFLTNSDELNLLYKEEFPDKYKEHQKFLKETAAKSIEEKNKLEENFRCYLFSDGRNEKYYALGLWNKNSDLHGFVEKNSIVLKRLNEVVFEFLKEIDSSEFVIKPISKGIESKSFSITYNTLAFEYCILISEKYNFNIKKFREKIIEFIPYSNEIGLDGIFKIIGGISGREIDIIFEKYTQFNENHLIEYMSRNFISLVENCRSLKFIPILRKIVEQPGLDNQIKTSSLELLSEIEGDVNYVRNVFVTFERDELSEVANGLLVSQYQDEEAIKWGCQKLKEKAERTEKSNDDFLSLQRDYHEPLNKINSPKVVDVFLDLLEHSFILLIKSREYYGYASYLWDIVFKYFDRLKLHKSYRYLQQLEKTLQKIDKTVYGYSWCSEMFKKLQNSYSDALGKSLSIYESIKKYNKVKEKPYLDISSSYELFQLCIDIINEELKRWVEEEGAYHVINEAKGTQEVLIQKTLKSELERSFASRGFTVRDVKIKREEQLLDDKRLDFSVNYGFIGSVVIEIKRFANKEVYNKEERSKYKQKMLQYISGSDSDYGIYLLFQDEEKYTLEDLLHEVQEVYNDCPNIEVLGLNCIAGKEESIVRTRECVKCKLRKTLENFYDSSLISEYGKKCNDCKSRSK